MLTKRTNILFDDALWTKLVEIAKKEKTSMGNIVRSAVKERVENEEILAQRKEAVDWILKNRPKPFKGKIDYKELINYGRKR